MNNNTNDHGFVTLITLLLVGSIGMAVAITMINTNIDAAKTTLAKNFHVQARSLANACAEKGLLVLKDTQADSSGTDTLAGGSCEYNAIIEVPAIGSGKLTAKGLYKNSISYLDIRFSGINPIVTLTSWREKSGPP